jgi:two-component system nitrogen regulation response regulator GlnG
MSEFKHKLLVIDDERSVRYGIQQVLSGDDLAVLTAETADEGLRLVAEQSPDLVLLDIRLGRRSGLEVFQELLEVDPKCLVVFITGHGTADTAIEAMKLGAYDYLVKPLDFGELKKVVGQAFEISRLMRVPATVGEGDRPEHKPEQLIGSGPAMRAICKQIGRIAPQDVNVLVLGESGTGKELVARAIYHHSRRSAAPFLAINCAAIPEALLESELFGHEKGAFTGADRRRIGKFEQCHDGTLFLDEVGDMALATQAKMLRLLEEGKFERVGGNETITARVRLIAATNQNLDRLIEEGRFRRDLYYRLRGVTIHLPPLRQRLGDIPELAQYFLFRFKDQVVAAAQTISAEALDIFSRYAWPGNVRELQNVVREALIASTGPTLLPEFLPKELLREAQGESSQPPRPAHSNGAAGNEWQELGDEVERAIARGELSIYHRALEQFDRILLEKALAASGGHKARAAEILGLSRVTTRAKLRAIEQHAKDER